ncbi:integrase, partial [Paenibacillus larvae]|nr:integrase [Paenibacillus larvae]MDT2182717.1 integrase [Paenibacillus larvae]MDT2198892.1 integrase [Paenibacillus larvae]MDT2208339.1 integrase [Paenibacillus larvae]
MRERYGISEQGKQIVQDFIHSLTIHEDLNPKTLKEYASDLKHFIGWFETANYQEENIVFRIEDVATPT